MPEYYGWQIEHQMMVSGLRCCHLWVFDGSHGLLFEVAARTQRWQEIHSAWDSFVKYLESDTPPPLIDRDTRVRNNETWLEAAERFLVAKQQSEVSAAALDDTKAALVSLVSHPSESGAGVTVSQFWKRGSVDYKRVTALQGVDLDGYRSPSRMETRVVAN